MNLKCEGKGMTQANETETPSNAAQVPLIELMKSVPPDARLTLETQWAEDGTATGHCTTPVGRYLHEAADRIEELERDLTASRAALAVAERERKEFQSQWHDARAYIDRLEGEATAARSALSAAQQRAGELRAKISALPVIDIARAAGTKWGAAAISRELVLSLIDAALRGQEGGNDDVVA